ncbi:MAG: hypothetical protein NTY19_04670 [Planctomycetota bacterium]|nr:hypothetical protein [Planctomycetota bacterium]
MQRNIGMTLMALSIIAAAFLLVTGNLGSERVTGTTRGQVSFVTWDLTDVAYFPNWWVVVPVGSSFLVGLFCAVRGTR